MESVQQASQNFTNSYPQVLIKIPKFTTSFFSRCFNKLSTAVHSLKEIFGVNKEVFITASLVSAAILYFRINRQQSEKQYMRKFKRKNTHESSEEQIPDHQCDQQHQKEQQIHFSDLNLTESYEFYSKQSNRTCLQVVQELSNSEEDDKVFFEIYRGYQLIQ